MNICRHRSFALLLSLAAVAAVGGCRDREPEQPEFENEVENGAPVTEPEIDVSVPEAPVENVQPEPKHAPPPEISDEQQVLDDAAAVGMTARLPRGNATAAAEPDTLPPPSADAGTQAESGADNSGQGLGQIY